MLCGGRSNRDARAPMSVVEGGTVRLTQQPLGYVGGVGDAGNRNVGRTTSSSVWQSDSMGGAGAWDDLRRCAGRGGAWGDLRAPGDFGLETPPLSSSRSRKAMGSKANAAGLNTRMPLFASQTHPLDLGARSCKPCPLVSTRRRAQNDVERVSTRACEYAYLHRGPKARGVQSVSVQSLRIRAKSLCTGCR